MNYDGYAIEFPGFCITQLYNIEAAQCVVHVDAILQTVPILLRMSLLYFHPLTHQVPDLDGIMLL